MSLQTRKLVDGPSWIYSLSLSLRPSSIISAHLIELDKLVNRVKHDLSLRVVLDVGGSFVGFSVDPTVDHSAVSTDDVIMWGAGITIVTMTTTLRLNDLSLHMIKRGSHK